MESNLKIYISISRQLSLYIEAIFTPYRLKTTLCRVKWCWSCFNFILNGVNFHLVELKINTKLSKNNSGKITLSQE